jgi:hypothetical protein
MHEPLDPLSPNETPELNSLGSLARKACIGGSIATLLLMMTVSWPLVAILSGGTPAVSAGLFFNIGMFVASAISVGLAWLRLNNVEPTRESLTQVRKLGILPLFLLLASLVYAIFFTR